MNPDGECENPKRAASNRQTKVLINKNITEYTKKMEEINE